MRYLYILLFLFALTSCNSSKPAVKDVPKTQVISENEKEESLPKVGVKKNEIEVIEEVIIQSDEEEIEVEVEETAIEPKLEDIVEQIEIAEVFDHNSWNTLLQKHVSNKGNVNYKGFKNNRKDLVNYIALLSKFMPNNTWKKEDKLAYWINAYNALTVDLILRNYPLKSIKDIKDPWDQRLWKLGEKWYNLNQIEHQILRKMDEPRIHFAIVCASYSCPKLSNKAYTAIDLERQLVRATRDFLKDPEKNNLTENNIKISKIFKWFAKDFKTAGSLLDFINKYSNVSIAKNAKKSYKDYNWDLNE